MEKVYVVHWDYDGMFDIYICSSLEKARAKLRKLVGRYILDCIAQGDNETAMNFISKLHCIDTDAFDAYSSDTDELYITIEFVDKD